MVKQSQDHVTVPGTIPVLLTRPEAQSLRLAEALRLRHDDRVCAVISPLLVPAFTRPEMPPGPFSATIFTSETAVAAAIKLGSRGVVLTKDAVCVGAQTAAAAREAGFSAISADGDAEALIALILAMRFSHPLLYLHGQHTRGNIGQRLVAAGVETVSRVVYRQDPKPFSDAALTLLQADGPIVAPIFSPRTARLFHLALPVKTRADLWIAAMSDAVVAAAEPLHPKAVEIAASPDADAMISAIGRLVSMAHGS